MTSAEQTARARSAARLAAVQALYQMELGRGDANDVVAEFIAHRVGIHAEYEEYQCTDIVYFSGIVRGAVVAQVRIDKAIESALAEGWTLGRLDSTLRALLRAATFEVLETPSVPARVIINEYVNIAHAFFDTVEPSFVNGVLDAIARAARPQELSALHTQQT